MTEFSITHDLINGLGKDREERKIETIEKTRKQKALRFEDDLNERNVLLEYSN